MSEIRVPVEIITHRLPPDDGKKTTRIGVRYELFPASQFAGRWSPARCAFYPKVPLAAAARRDYWQTLYRVRRNGRWIHSLARYHFFTRQEIITMLVNDRRV